MPVATSSDAHKPKARRTHARRSCNLCKVRKTRCELPDLDVPSSSSPVPDGKACHRCRVLSLPCVVDDSNMKSRRQGKKSGSGTPTGATNDAITATTIGLSSRKRQRRSYGGSMSPSPVGSAALGQGDGEGSRHVYAPPLTKEEALAQARAVLDFGHLKFNGRPLHLLAAILKKIGAAKPKDKTVVVFDMPKGKQHLHPLVDEEMQYTLAPGFEDVRCLHPHLQRLSGLLKVCESSHGAPDVELLLAVSLYVASQKLQPVDGHPIRELVSPYLHKDLYTVLTKQPRSFYAIQALEILALHGPSAPTLPLAPGLDVDLIDPSRGIIGAALNISASVSFDNLVHSGLQRRDNQDFWLWLGVTAVEAQAQLEDEVPRKRPRLEEARGMVAPLMLEGNEHLWDQGAGLDDPSELLGKLTVCDRLARLDELHALMLRLRQLVEASAELPNVPGDTAADVELKAFQRTMAFLEKRHCVVYDVICRRNRGLPRNTGPIDDIGMSWNKYRCLKAAWENLKAVQVAIQTVVALHYIPDSSLGFSDVKTNTSMRSTVVHALRHASNPVSIKRAFEHGDGKQYLKELAEQRTRIAEVLVPFHYGAAHVLPLHEGAAILVEATKVIFDEAPQTGISNTEHAQKAIDALRAATDRNGCLVDACSDIVAMMIPGA